MEYSKIIAVTGLPGLYELLNSKPDGAIVRSLEDKISKFVSSRIHNFSHLESIEVFTTRENTNLVDILTAMDKSGEKLPDEKDSEALKNYFKKVYPDLDFERVYSSDLKKMVKWYSILKSNNIEFKLAEEPVEEKAEEVPEEPVKKPKKEAAATIAPAAVEKPAAKPKKSAPKKEEPVKAAAAEAKPKKAPAKKKIKE
jgi:cell division septation protein DedD